MRVETTRLPLVTPSVVLCFWLKKKNMQLTQLINVALLAAGATVEAGPLLKATAADLPALNLANATLEQIAQNALTVAKARIPSDSTCTPDKLSVRKWW
ncbi:hypothetical protein SLS55_004989 [Diplodia seriata]|uniref:Uncharacterized protein n=1 Tax=Diplodia seriata TaxID=420778 RepID=A0ABR3CKZ0_9PEZI